jgi:Transposase, Mutator family/Domain of unknown function (DUF4234)
VLDALPKRLQPDAKKLLHEIMEVPTRADARRALERFREQFDAKYPKAVAKLDKDWAHLTAFYDFPAEHGRHLRTSNAIESSFATVKLRNARDEGRRQQEGALAMAYKLLDAAQSNIGGEVAALTRGSRRRARASRSLNERYGLWLSRCRSAAPGSQVQVKLGSPWAAALLPIITLGIYHLVWWYRINRELRNFGRARGYDLGQSPTSSLLALVPGSLVIVPPLVSYWRGTHRVQGAARVSGREPVNGCICLVPFIGASRV